MKSFLLTLLVLISIGASAQNKDCSRLWLGDPYDSIDVIKQTAEQYLNTQLKMSVNPDVKTIYEMEDAEKLSLIKIWMKQKRTVSGGTITTTYAINSFKITGSAENIDMLFKALKEKVAKCSAESSSTSVVFSFGKISVENQGGDWSKKNIPLSTLTIASK